MAKNTINQLIGIFMILLIFTPVFISASPLISKCELFIKGSQNDPLKITIENNLNEVLNSMDQPVKVKEYFSTYTYQNYLDLLEVTQMSLYSVVYEVDLLTLSDNNYEIRNIDIYINSGVQKTDSIKSLVFEFNNYGIIVDVKLALEMHQYIHVLDQSESQKTIEYQKRLKILGFLENLQTSYNRKDLLYIENVYSDNALIIVGKVIKVDRTHNDFLEKSSSFSRKKIKYLKRTKSEYIQQLKNVFTSNEYIHIVFDDVEVYKHRDYDYIYGVQLEQSYKSTSYADHGYLFFMINFKDLNNPVIQVRTWQPEKGEDGSVINLYKFNL